MTKTTQLTLEEAQEFLKEHKRHYSSYSTAIPFAAIGLSVDGELHGAAILGRTEAGRGKLIHIYVDGTWGGYSYLYGACWRAYHALGYETVDL